MGIGGWLYLNNCRSPSGSLDLLQYFGGRKLPEVVCLPDLQEKKEVTQESHPVMSVLGPAHSSRHPNFPDTCETLVTGAFKRWPP